MIFGLIGYYLMKHSFFCMSKICQQYTRAAPRLITQRMFPLLPFLKGIHRDANDTSVLLKYQYIEVVEVLILGIDF